MLILKRKTGQEIVVSQGQEAQIVVRLLSVKGNYVTLGLEAAESLRIYRAEVWSRMGRARARQTATGPFQAEQTRPAARP